MKLTDFRVLSFDCYGTLIDWETGILEALRPLTKQTAPRLDDNLVLEAFAHHETAVEAEHPSMLYSDVLAHVYLRLAAEWGLDPNGAGPESFGASVSRWPAFEDSAEALRSLMKHYKLVILSNVDRRGFVGSAQRLGIDFDYVFTAEDIGSYKPSLHSFEYMLERLSEAGFAKADILHTAQSLFHDHAPANRIGLRSAWINRQQGRAGATVLPDPIPRFDFEFASLAEMAATVG